MKPNQGPFGEEKQCLPTQEDWERIRKQQKLIADEVAQRYGATLTGALSDIEILQRLVDDAVYSADEKYELQSLGLSLGEVLVKQLGFHWITYADDLGQDPAIQYGDTSIIAHPLTMISKRVEDGEDVDLEELYAFTARLILRKKDSVAPSEATSTWWTRLLSWWKS